MWKSHCYKLVLLVNKQTVHLQKLKNYNIYDSETLDVANKQLVEVMIQLQELFLINQCPILPPELPEPMEYELFKGMPVFNEPITKTQITFSETMTKQEMTTRINEIKYDIYQIAKQIGVAQFTDLYALSHKKISQNISSFLDTYFCLTHFCKNLTAKEFSITNLGEPPSFLITKRGVTIKYKGFQYNGFLLQNSLFAFQKGLVYLPEVICSKMCKPQDYLNYPREVFASLPMKERFILRNEELDKELEFRHKLYRVLRSISFKECNLFIKNKQCCVKYSAILELLIALNKNDFVRRICDNNTDIRKCWQGLPEMTVELSIEQKKKELPKKIQTLIDKMNQQEKKHGEKSEKSDLFKNTLIKFPWSTPELIQLDWEYLEEIFKKNIYGHEDAKQQIRRTLVKWNRNQSNCQSGMTLSLCGPPGVGKTHFVSFLGKALGLPLISFHLGGQSDAEQLIGHGYTYSSARPGKLVQELANAGTRRCILFFDELDKATGDQIINVLIHLTDKATNSKFQDRFFSGIEFDFSDCLIIFSYNSRESIDPILLDRIQEIRVDAYTPEQKMQLVNQFVLPELKNILNIDTNWITPHLIKKIILNYTRESGIRKLKQHLELICCEYAYQKEIKGKKWNPNNALTLLGSSYNITELKNNTVHGLYATKYGVGGVTPIQIKFTTLKNILTGRLGETMKESVQVAEQVASELVKIPKRKYYHLHIPAAGTPKDGPSAGLAITLAFYFLHSNENPRRDTACTGEIDIFGNVSKIGGIGAKITGALNAGIKRVILPKDNQSDYERIFKKKIKKLEVHFVKNVHQAISLFKTL